MAKWWTTPSAQAAMKRAKDNRRKRLDDLKKRVTERKEKLQQEIEEL